MGILSIYLKSKSLVNHALILLDDWKRGNLKLEISDVKEALNSPYGEVKYAIVEGLLKRREWKLIKELLPIEENSKPIRFTFPTVPLRDNGESKLNEAFAFKSKETFSNKEKIKLNSVEKFLGHKVGVIFKDADFDGESFQAPLAYSLKFGEIPESVLISGYLQPNGDFEADKIEEKRQLAQKHGKILIGKGNILKLHDFLSKEKVQIPLIVGRETRDYKNAFLNLVKEYDLDTLEGSFDKEKLIVKFPGYLSPSEEWKSYIERFKDVIGEIKKLPNFSSLHLGLDAPAPLCLGMGVVTGTGRIGLAIYHFEGGKYKKVIDLRENSRKIKKRTEKFKRVKVEEEIKGRDKALIAVQLASHETREKTRALSEELFCDFYYISAKDKGAIDLNFDWSELVSEVYEEINRVYSFYKEIELIMSVPTPIAFALGMAAGHYWPIRVWQYFREVEGYRPVLTVNELEPV